MPGYSFYGWASAVILSVMVLPFVLLWLNRHVIKTRDPGFMKTIKLLRKVHKPLGIVFAVVALVHGVMVLGAFRLHTGWLLYIGLILTAVSGGAFYRLKKRPLFQLHRWLAAVVVLLFALHFFLPWAI